MLSEEFWQLRLHKWLCLVAILLTIVRTSKMFTSASAASGIAKVCSFNRHDGYILILIEHPKRVPERVNYPGEIRFRLAC